MSMEERMSRKSQKRPRPTRLPRPPGLDPNSPLGINIPGKSQHREIKVDVAGVKADQLEDAVSVFWDLLIADMACHHARSAELAAAGLLYARRACWETAIISYSRCFEGGRGAAGPRARHLTSLVDQLDPQQRECHDYVLGMRNSQIAHHIDGVTGGSGRVYLAGSRDADGVVAISEIETEWSGELYDLPVLERLEGVVYFIRTKLFLEIDRHRFELFDMAREDLARISEAYTKGMPWSPLLRDAR